MTATETPAEPEQPATTVVVNAEELAFAWRTVTRACSDDYSRPILTGVSVEVYGPDTLRLTATDSYQLYTCVVGHRVDVEDLDAEPDSTWLIDPLTPITRRLLRRAYPPSDLTLTFRIGSVRLDVILGSESSAAIELPAIAGEYPPWRGLVRKSLDKAPENGDGRINFGHLTLPALAELVRDNVPAELTITGPLNPVLVRMGGGYGVPTVLGAIMPVRVS